MGIFSLWVVDGVRRLGMVSRATESSDRKGARTVACSIVGEAAARHGTTDAGGGGQSIWQS